VAGDGSAVNAARFVLDPARHGTLPAVNEPSAPLPPEALQYYARGQEAARLEQGHGLLHHPNELRAEVAEAGFSVEAVLGVEGPGWRVPPA